MSVIAWIGKTPLAERFEADRSFVCRIDSDSRGRLSWISSQSGCRKSRSRNARLGGGGHRSQRVPEPLASQRLRLNANTLERKVKPMPVRRRRVFLSHSSEDDDLVALLIDGLRSRGLKPFADNDPKDGIQPGEAWLDRLSKALKQADSVILVISQDWIDSLWCQAEYRTALLLKKRIIPIVVGGAQHREIEPRAHKVFLSGDEAQVDPAVLDSISRALPTRLSTWFLAVLLSLVPVALAALGLAEKPLGHWDLVEFGGGVAKDLARDVSQPDRLYAAFWKSDFLGTGGLFESMNSGRTWRRLEIPLGGNPNRVFSDADELLVASDGAALSFDRRQASWQSLDLGGLSSEYLFLRPFPGKTSNLLWGTVRPSGASGGAGTAGGLGAVGVLESNAKLGGLGIRRKDGTLTYAEFPATDADFHPRLEGVIVAAAPSGPGLVVSYDEGATFQVIDGFHGRQPLRVLITKDGDSIYAAALDGAWRARVEKWEGASFQFERVHEERALTGCLAQAGDHIYYGTDHGLFVIRDRDADFERFHVQPPVSHVNDILPLDDRLLVATSGGGVFELRAEQDAWKPVLASGSMSVSFGGAFGDFSLVGAGGLLFRSPDAGRTWAPIYDFNGNVLNLISVRPHDDRKGLRAGDYRLRNSVARAGWAYQEALLFAGVGKRGLFRKRSGELGWEDAQVGEKGVVNSLSQSLSKPNVLAAVVNQKCFLSRDSGTSWTEVGAESTRACDAVYPHPRDGFWVSGVNGDRAGLFRCDDDGANWRFVSELDTNVGVSGASPVGRGRDRLFVSVDGRVHYYNAELDTFERRGQLPIEGSLWIEIAEAPDGDVYAGCQEGMAFRSPDGGATWTRLPFDSLLKDGQGKILGIGLDEKGWPQFFTNKGMLVRSGDVVAAVGGWTFTWKLGTLMNRLGLGQSPPGISVSEQTPTDVGG